MKTKEISLKPLLRLSRDAGVKRISRHALEELREMVRRKIEEITVEASLFARHAGRVTVRDDDVKLALRKFKFEGG